MTDLAITRLFDQTEDTSMDKLSQFAELSCTPVACFTKAPVEEVRRYRLVTESGSLDNQFDRGKAEREFFSSQAATPMITGFETLMQQGLSFRCKLFRSSKMGRKLLAAYS